MNRLFRRLILLGGAVVLSASLQMPVKQEIPLRSVRIDGSGVAVRGPSLVFSPVQEPSAAAVSSTAADTVLRAPGGTRKAVIRAMKPGDCPRVSADFVADGRTLHIDAVGVCGAQGWVYYYGFVAAGESFVAGREVYLVSSAGVRRNLSAPQEKVK